MDIFVVGLNGAAWSAWFDDTKGGWQSWFQLGTRDFNLHQPLSAISHNDTEMDVFGIGKDNRIYNARYVYQWAAQPEQIWQPVGDMTFPSGNLVSTVSKLASDGSGVGLIDIFAVDSNGYVYNATLVTDEGYWSGWNRILDGVFPPSARIAARAYWKNGETIELFGVAEDNIVYTAWWDGTWYGWTPISDNIFPVGAHLSVEMPFGSGIWGIAKDGTIWQSSANWGDPAGGFSQVTAYPHFSDQPLSRYYYYHDQDNADEVQVLIGSDSAIWWSPSYAGVFNPMTFRGI
jgi:hypothetical protein